MTPLEANKANSKGIMNIHGSSFLKKPRMNLHIHQLINLKNRKQCNQSDKREERILTKFGVIGNL